MNSMDWRLMNWIYPLVTVRMGLDDEETVGDCWRTDNDWRHKATNKLRNQKHTDQNNLESHLANPHRKSGYHLL